MAAILKDIKKKRCEFRLSEVEMETLSQLAIYLKKPKSDVVGMLITSEKNNDFMVVKKAINDLENKLDTVIKFADAYMTNQKIYEKRDEELQTSIVSIKENQGDLKEAFTDKEIALKKEIRHLKRDKEQQAEEIAELSKSVLGKLKDNISNKLKGN